MLLTINLVIDSLLLSTIKMALKRKLSSGFSDGLISPNFKQIREQAGFDLAYHWLIKNNLNRFIRFRLFLFKTEGLVYGINSQSELYGIAPLGVWDHGLPCIPPLLRS